MNKLASLALGWFPSYHITGAKQSRCIINEGDLCVCVCAYM